MKNLFKAAHKMAREIKALYPEVNYSFQFSLCLKYLTSKKEDTMIELEGSEKQITWATEIRNSNIKLLQAEIDQLKARYHPNFDIAIAKFEKAIIEAQTKQSSAKYWIDHQGVAGVYIQKVYSK